MPASPTDPLDGVLVEARPLVGFLYALLRSGDVPPWRLERLLEELEDTPPAIATHYDLPHLARHAAEAADRLEAMPHPPIRIRHTARS
jgi:hypothetical protein